MAAAALGGRARRSLASLFVFALAFAFHLWIEFREPGLLEVDGYYHVKIAHLYATGELPILGGEFPWMAYASFGKLFADWQLGYHLLLVPFSWLGLLFGAKLSAAFFAALLVATAHAILRAQRVPAAWLFALSLCATSELHLLRSHLVRPTTLVVTLMLVVAHCAASRRTLGLFLATLALLLVYAVPHNALAALAVAGVAFALSERRVPWKVPAVMLAAIAGSILLHPGFWHWQGSFLGSGHALFRVWQQMDGSLQAANDGDTVVFEGKTIRMPAPAEFRAPERTEIVGFLSPLVLFLAALLLLAVPGRRRVSPFQLTTLGLAALYFFLFLAHIRFFEYWIPFTILGLGASIGRWLGDDLAAAARAWRAAPRWRAAAGTLLAGGCLAVVGRQSYASVDRVAEMIDTGHTGGGLDYQGAMEWIEANTEAGELVFHDRWPSFSPMFFFNHHNRYVIGLDPYFFFQLDPSAYRRWIGASNGKLSPEETRAVVLDFGARFACTRKNSAFAERLGRAPGVEIAYQDRRFVVLRVRGD